MARGDDDRVVTRVVVDGIDVCPVAARPRTGDVAEGVRRVHLRELFGRHRLTGLRGVDVEAHGALVERLHDVVAIGVENVEETEFVHDRTAFIDFDDHVAHRMDALAVGTTQVRRGHAQERVTVLRRVERVRIVGVAHRQATVEDFAAEHVVLGVALAVTEDEVAVGRLLEAHHDARLVGLLGVVHFDVGHEVPTHGARRVDDRVFGTERPFERAAHGVVPHEARSVGGSRNEVVDEVETILEGGIHLFDLHVERRMGLAGRAVRTEVNGGRVELIAVLEVFDFAVVNPVEFDFDRVEVVGIKTEDRNAAVVADVRVRHLVREFLTARLRHDAHGDVPNDVAAVANDGRKRRDAVRVHDDFAQMALSEVGDVRARGAARGEGASRARNESETAKCGERRRNVLLANHERVPLVCGGGRGLPWLREPCRPYRSKGSNVGRKNRKSVLPFRCVKF